MSYILEPDRAGPAPWLQRVALSALVVLAVAVLYLGGHRGQAATAPDSLTEPATRVSWSMAGPWPVPISGVHGPLQTTDGLATGFSHDKLGAALAAFNITYRLNSEVGPTVYETTDRDQTFGDPDAMLAQIRIEPSGGSATPTQFFYRILVGDPTGESVLVSIAVRSPDSARRGGYFATQRSLRWIGGDWRMAVPMTPAAAVGSLPGYQLLGSPHV